MIENVNNDFVTEEETFETIGETLEELGDGACTPLPDPYLVSHYALDANRKLFMDAAVDLNTIEVTKRIIRWNMEDDGIPVEKRKPIWLYMMNYGGIADYAWQLIDVMLTSETPIFTVNLGVCGSAGALIYLAGHKRFMMKRAILMIHEGSIAVSGDAQKFNDAADSYKRMLKAMRAYILERTRIAAGTLSRKKDNDWELDATYCLEHGVCEHIVEHLSEIL